MTTTTLTTLKSFNYQTLKKLDSIKNLAINLLVPEVT